MSFTPRTTAPKWGDPYWFSNNPFYPEYGLPNCTAYAFGRFHEILGSYPKLHTGDAGTWYGHTSDGYKRGSTPRVGAVACWAKPGAAGHVAIVEKVNSDGSILTSESAWSYPKSPSNSNYFYTRTRTPNNYASNSYIFQGFIYNPATENVTFYENDPLVVFLRTAQSQVGQGCDWTYSVSGLGYGQPWCAAFVVACAKKANILNKIIAFSYGAGELARAGVRNGYGTWAPGPSQRRQATPAPGDLILFRWDGVGAYSDEDTYCSDHVGIVKEVKNNRVYTIEGNADGSSNTTRKVASWDYSLTDGRINGYFRPNWSKVGSSGYVPFDIGEGYLTPGVIGPLYTSLNTKEDAVIREVAYVKPNAEPSINKTNIRLSVINYTTLLNAYYEAFAAKYGVSIGPGYGSGTQYNADGLASVPRQIVKFFTDKGLSQAVGIGVAANVQGECSFDISLTVVDSNGKYSSGMCMWNGANGTAMIQYVGSDWKTNLTGQLNFLWYDMTERQPGWFQYMINRIYGQDISIIEKMRQLPNTLEGAKQAADIFVRAYENPGDPDGASSRRQGYAEELWNKLVPITNNPMVSIPEEQ